ncbi:MAG: hypothetical protein AAGB51_10400 [Planctomycetota bacterium]
MRIERGAFTDYLALARHHYVSAMPACPVLVLRAMKWGILAGVLVVSMPTMNGAWRRIAWKEQPEDRSQRVRWLNAHVRTLSRLVIDPRVRGLGIATALVRKYLADPVTERTEASA